MSWQSTPLLGSRISGSRAGRSAKATAGASNASNRGSASRRHRLGQPAMVRPVLAARRRDMADLARNQPQPPAMEGAAERHRHLRVAIPAQFQHRRLESRKRQGRGKPGRRTAGVEQPIAIGRRRLGPGKADAELARQCRPRRVDIDQRDLNAGKLGAEIGDQACRPRRRRPRRRARRAPAPHPRPR